MSQIISIYKPKGPTSNDVVKILKKYFNEKKVGHAGTLDPLARGVLVIGVGREATKKLGDIVKKEKEYIANIKLGQNSTTDDEEGEKTQIKIKHKPTTDEIKSILTKFEGKIKQTPPIYSAIKVKGQEAYKLARKGMQVELKPRIVEIKQIKLLKYAWPNLEIKVTCGPGTYIRSLARDIGKELNTGGYLTELERTRVGQFRKEQAESISKFKRNC
ncbi:tRNA pseudouridine(55) synthase TruB [Patescibacteria group bacterium]|nr:tRNA pseudouridine(55) synthase TruB [Patescibacteria group bacterium]